MSNRFPTSPSSLLRAIAVLPIRIYQRLVSPMIGPRCRYAPTCSHYAVEAIQVHGIIKGILLGIWRILRCNPWSLGGVDYVPAKGKWTSEEWVPPVDWAGNATDIVRPTPMGLEDVAAATYTCEDNAASGATPGNAPCSTTSPMEPATHQAPLTKARVGLVPMNVPASATRHRDAPRVLAS
ncbi:membrane protein insertion efficiency factor YidD [Schaalia vaccimaxillae]|uniref:membrane protein insertion efficiency factor YidD n=1 Tax=Schaalia vaccimaxillae TaxID=183916 RepID=UPI0003B75372